VKHEPETSMASISGGAPAVICDPSHPKLWLLAVGACAAVSSGSNARSIAAGASKAMLPNGRRGAGASARGSRSRTGDALVAPGFFLHRELRSGTTVAEAYETTSPLATGRERRLTCSGLTSAIGKCPCSDEE
jgi:hypothetical protein